jgi:hypothetical protein
VVRGATGARRDERRAVTSAAGDARDAGGVEALARRIAGRLVVSRRDSIDFPAPGLSKRRRPLSECLNRGCLHNGHSRGFGISSVAGCAARYNQQGTLS